MQRETESTTFNGLLNIVLFVCCNSNAVVLFVTNAIDLIQLAELIKAMITMSISIISCLFMYINNREKIDGWFASIKWRKKKNHNEEQKRNF